MVLEARTTTGALPNRGLDPITRGAPEELLPSGDPTPPGLSLPVRSLAEDALAMLRTLRSARRPARWAAPGFAREVALVRSHLAPIQDRGSLVSSFAREAFHAPGGTGPSTAARMGPTRVAYAVRWLELGDGEARPAWAVMLGVGVAGTAAGPEGG